MEKNSDLSFTDEDFQREEQLINNLPFTQIARYRCEQANLSKIDGDLTGNGKQKFQYLMELDPNRRFGRVNLEEHHYDFFPAVINKSFEMISENEKIKNRVVFSLDEAGRFDRILNKSHLERSWRNFRDGDFEQLEFVQHLKIHNPDVYWELVNQGDKQFSKSYDAAVEYRTNLFYLMLFDDHLTNPTNGNFPEKEMKFASLLFPEIILPLKITTEILNEDAASVGIRRKSELLIDDELLARIKEAYDKLYLSSIKYTFSEYRMNFVINLKYDKASRLAEVAEGYIEEEVLNNLENICSYNVKRVKV